MLIEKIYNSLPASPIVLLLLCLLYGYVSFRVNRRKYLSIPGPVPWPIIGNYLDIRPYLSGALTIHDGFVKWAVEYGSMFKIWIGNKPWIIVSDPDLVKEILFGNKFPKDPVYYSPISKLYGQRFAGGGSAIQTNPHKYAQQRRITTLAYHKKYLPVNCSAILSVTGRWIDMITNYSEWINVCEEFDRLTSSSICKIAFDLDISFKIDGSDSNVHKMVSTCFQGIADKLFNPIGCTLYFKKMEKVRSAAKSLRDIGESFITNTYEAIRNGEPLPKGMFSYVLKELHEEGGSFTLEEIVDEFIIQFVAGTETVSNLMKFVMMELGRNEAVYQRLQDEIDRVMSQTTAATFFEDINKMPYLEQVIKETLRMYPIALATTRTNYVDTYLGKHKIPANSTIMVCMYVLHRNPNYFDRPDEFDPDRWGTDKPGPIPFSYIPFSSGPRACTGRHLAKLEAKVFLSNILYHFHVSPHPEQNYEISTTISIKPKHNLLMKFTDRQRPRDIFSSVEAT